MAITDYSSLVTAITDFAHRVTLASYADTFIAGAQEAIESDIYDLNFGNGIRFQEASYGPFAISNGVVPVPSDWLAPKVFAVADGGGQLNTLVFKAAAWIYDAYPVRQSSGLPAFIARDVWQSSFAAPQTFTCAQGQTVFTLSFPPSNASVMVVSLDGAMLYSGSDYTVSGTTLTLTSGAQGGQALSVQYLTTSSGQQQWTASSGQTSFALTSPNASIILASLDGVVLTQGTDYTVSGGFLNLSSGAQAGQTLTVYYAIGSVFVFGPFPDSAYNIQGTYYAKAPLLSNVVPTNWMVQASPYMLHAACMVEVAKFLKDTEMLGVWTPVYQQRLKALVDRDKAERWAASTLQMDVG